MNEQVVIARAFRGRPLKRVAVDAGNGLVYLADADTLEQVRAGALSPVGFPAVDVFAFNEAVFEELATEWDRRGQTDASLWGQLGRYRAIPASRG